jgi:hypothetical protein
MSRSLGTGPVGDYGALETFVSQAGAAMACAYSSSDEFEAALIAERRAAGVYGPRRHRQTLVTAAGVVTALIVIVLLIV